MSTKAVLYRELDGTEFSVELPLTSFVDPREVMEELELPSYIDLKYFPMENALVTIWAAVNAPEMHKRYPNVFDKKICDKPIPALVFGGSAVKILCKDSNGGGSLSRSLKDVDFIVPKDQGWKFYKLLLSMGAALGTRFTSFATSNDRRFTGWRHGERYRVTTINGVKDDGVPTVTVMDVLCDAINLRHKLDVREAFKSYRENMYTIGIENLILSKAQFITETDRQDLEKLKEHGQEYRVLSYDHYDKNKIILGMEEKDVKDVCAIFLDHPIGGPGGVDSQKLRKALRDERMALTVTLNLRNLIEHPEAPRRWLSKSEVALIVERIGALLKDLPRVDKKWDKPWWNTSVETPVIA
ncbi:MAG: hypothetical protein QW390_00045 [Candidatus Bathyarchaeia archaeon]